MMDISDKLNEARQKALEDAKTKALRDIQRKLELQMAAPEVKPPEWMRPAPEPAKAECEVCGGLGLVMRPVNVGHPDYGKAFECPAKCEAVARNHADRVERMLENVRRKTAREDQPYAVYLDDFEQIADNEDRRLAYKVAQILIKHQEVRIENVTKNSVVFTGATGTGKTFISSAITNEMSRMGRGVWFMRVYEMISRVQGAYKSDGEFTDEQIISSIQRVPVLVLDEFDINNLTPDRLDIVERVIDYRYTHRMATVCTTNLTQAEFKQRWGYRTASRLIEMAHWIRVEGSMRNQDGVI